MAEAVKVMVRCRPMNQKQKDRGCQSVVNVDTKNRQIILFKQDSKQQPKSFTYDCVFGQQSAQNLIYEQSAFSLVDNVLEGYNGTIFAYGQTGCGKTHTMMGLSNNTQQSRGIIPRTFSQIMTITKSDSSKTHLVRCSFIQIYNEQIHDLLGKDIKTRMELKQSPEKGIFVKDLTQIQVESISKMEHYMEIGFKNRATRQTNMNKQSSRSHSLFSIYIDSQQIDDKGNDKYKASKLNLVDLAGSQRASKTGATGDGMKQATKINLSLSALGNVISALVDGKTHHIPYRDSKLTRLLQDSLGGNTKTIMIAAISPANYNYDQTLSTLRYASRAKFIQNKPKINEDPKDALLREYMDQIKRLKMMLQGKMPLQMISNGDIVNHGPAGVQQRIIYKNMDDDQNNAIVQQLRNKQNQLRVQQQQKRKLAQKLQALQGHLTKGAQPGESDANNKQLEKIKKLKQKLKSQKKKQQEYEYQKTKRQEQLLSIQKNYKSLNEQVDQMKQRFQQIKKKYIGNLSQLRDIQNQHEDEKQQLLDTIRFQEKQIKKFSKILNILMTEDQLDMIVNNSQWNQDKRQWIVPYFTYRQKKVALPKIQSTQDPQSERDKKQITFRSSKNSEKRDDNFKVNNIVRNARESSQFDLPPSGQNMRSNNYHTRAQLTPLKNESSERVKGTFFSTQHTQERSKKYERLDPIQFGNKQSPDLIKKYLQY